jgi:hypothetical protein
VFLHFPDVRAGEPVGSPQVLPAGVTPPWGTPGSPVPPQVPGLRAPVELRARLYDPAGRLVPDAFGSAGAAGTLTALLDPPRRHTRGGAGGEYETPTWADESPNTPAHTHVVDHPYFHVELDRRIIAEIVTAVMRMFATEVWRPHWRAVMGAVLDAAARLASAPPEGRTLRELFGEGRFEMRAGADLVVRPARGRVHTRMQHSIGVPKEGLWGLLEAVADDARDHIADGRWTRPRDAHRFIASEYLEQALAFGRAVRERYDSADEAPPTEGVGRDLAGFMALTYTDLAYYAHHDTGEMVTRKDLTLAYFRSGLLGISRLQGEPVREFLRLHAGWIQQQVRQRFAENLHLWGPAEGQPARSTCPRSKGPSRWATTWASC